VLQEPRFHHHYRGGTSECSRPLVSSHTGLNAVVGALEELQLSAPEAHAPKRDQLLNFDFRKLEHQLTVYLGPHPSWEDLCALTFSFINIMT
jgi:hypothetical protein